MPLRSARKPKSDGSTFNQDSKPISEMRLAEKSLFSSVNGIDITMAKLIQTPGKMVT
jgi:hypothetical protein